MKRIESVLRKLDDAKLDALLLIKHEAVTKENVRYMTGFTGSSAYVIISPQGRILLTDDRYTEQASEQCPDFQVVRHGTPVMKDVKETIQKFGIRKVGFEADGVTVGLLDTLKEKLEGIELVPTKDMIEELRALKDATEVQLIARASQIADQGFSHILDFIKPGATEKDIALELEFYMRKQGASGLAFGVIIVSGKRSSHQHGAPSDKRIEDGDFVTMDFGATYEGYRTDMTRTVVVGHATQKQINVYNTVKEAQQRALELMRAGVLGRDASAEARKIIEDAGYGEYSGFGIGHGVGLEIHEAPYVRASGDLVLQAGHVVTVEPGIYIPDWGGVRIEDTVVIEKDGCRRLTESPKDLIVL